MFSDVVEMGFHRNDWILLVKCGRATVNVSASSEDSRQIVRQIVNTNKGTDLQLIGALQPERNEI